MKLLANTIGYNIKHSFKQNRLALDPATYFGKGKVKEVFEKASLLKINTIFINDDIGPREKDLIEKSFSFFVKTDFLPFFKKNVLPLIKKKFILMKLNYQNMKCLKLI